MVKSSEQSIYIEQFNFILENNDGVVSALDLIKYLTNLNTLVKSVNHTLNSKYSVGFDQVLLEVIALEKGSFKIPVTVKKILQNPYTQLAVGAVFGAIAANVLSDNKETVNYYINNSTVEIKHEVIVENKETVRAVSNIAKTTIEAPEVKSLTLEYDLADNKRETINIQKSTLGGLVVDIIEDSEKQSNTLPHARLTIVSPVLEAEQAMWKFRMGDRKLSAKMTDTDFLDLMGKSKIAFGIGDVLVADLETIITMKSDDTPDVKHYIRKVHQYPQYATKTGETDLFASGE